MTGRHPTRGHPDVVYRAVRRDELPITSGLFATDPLAPVALVEHITSRPRLSPWVSTTRSLQIAQRFAGNRNGSIVTIDLNRVNSAYVDVSRGGTGNPRADQLAIEDQEVSIGNYVSPDPIIDVINGQ